MNRTDRIQNVLTEAELEEVGVAAAEKLWSIDESLLLSCPGVAWSRFLDGLGFPEYAERVRSQMIEVAREAAKLIDQVNALRRSSVCEDEMTMLRLSQRRGAGHELQCVSKSRVFM